MCATTVSAVAKFANGLGSRTADTAVARGIEFLNGLLGYPRRVTAQNSTMARVPRMV